MPCLLSALLWSNCKNKSVITFLYPVLRRVCRGREQLFCMAADRRELWKLQRLYSNNGPFSKRCYAAGKISDPYAEKAAGCSASL